LQLIILMRESYCACAQMQTDRKTFENQKCPKLFQSPNEFLSPKYGERQPSRTPTGKNRFDSWDFRFSFVAGKETRREESGERSPEPVSVTYSCMFCALYMGQCVSAPRVQLAVHCICLSGLLPSCLSFSASGPAPVPCRATAETIYRCFRVCALVTVALGCEWVRVECRVRGQLYSLAVLFTLSLASPRCEVDAAGTWWVENRLPSAGFFYLTGFGGCGCSK
jgi:hypothetical protein